MNPVSYFGTPFYLVPVVLLLDGCVSDSGDGESADRVSTVELALVDEVRHTDSLAYEPMVAEHPDGTLFVSGFPRVIDPDDPPRIWRSDDRGGSWDRVDVGSPADGAVGNSDPDMAIAPDGTLYSIHLGFDRSTQRGTHIAIGASPDKGITWTWRMLSEGNEEDRPWVDVAPDGTAHAIWNDNRGGVSYARSNDRGQSWDVRDRIHDVGGSSHLAVGPNGQVAVRITPLSWGGYQFDEGVELVAISIDGGDTWSMHEPPGDRIWIADAERTEETQLIDRWAETLAWDSAGTLYYLWSEDTTLWLGRSFDQGENWDSAELLAPGGYIFYPFLDAGPPGQLAAIWGTGRPGTLPGNDEEMQLQVGHIEWPADSAAAGLTLSATFPNDYWVEIDEGRFARAVGGDYLPVILLRDDSIGSLAPLYAEQGRTTGFTWRRFVRQ